MEKQICGCCGKEVSAEFKYCPYCGSYIDDYEQERESDVISDSFQEIYGPPPMRFELKCRQCGYTWYQNTEFGEDRLKEVKCPKCGSKSYKIINSEYDF